MTHKTEHITPSTEETHRSSEIGRYLLATSRSWNEGMAGRLSERCGARFDLVAAKSDLTVANLDQLKPRYLFFPHWSYIIPAAIYEQFECVIFHMTDLPFGRGGSPLQNLVSRGIEETRITALRCIGEVDAGPVYMKRPLSLHGNAEEIFLRAGVIIEDMICELVEKELGPVEQVGEPTVFKRRKPEQSNITSVVDLKSLFDHIRMLDADGYPHAFFQSGRFRFEFSRAARKQGRIVADVVITENSDE